MEAASGQISKEHKLIRNKVMKGLRISFRRLLEDKKQKDEELVFFENGKIKFVKARKIRG